MRANTWTNADGLSVGFGPLDSKNPNAGPVQTEGNIEVLQFPFDYDALNLAGTAPSTKTVPIPANSTILRGNIRVTTAFAGGTNVNFGFINAAGTAIDIDGLDAAVATAALDAGLVVTFDGALIGKSVGAADAYFGGSYSGTYTAGKGIITIEYVRPMPDSTSPSPVDGIVGSL